MVLRFLLSLSLIGLLFFSEKSQNSLYASEQNLSYSDTTQVNKLLKSVGPLIDRGDFEEALLKIDSVLTISESINFENGIVLANINKVEILVIQKQPDSALSVIDQALNTYPENDNSFRLHSLKGTTLNMKGLSEPALESFEKALALIDFLPNEKQNRTKAATLANMAGVYHRLGNKAKTIENYLLGLEFAEASKDTSFLLVVLNNLGDSYNTYAEYDRAEYYLERALDIATVKQFKPDLLRIHLNLANVYTNLEKFDQALEFYEKAIELNKEIRPDTPPFQIVYNLGELYMDLGQYDKARASFNESLQYCIDLNIPIGLYFNYRGLGNLSELLSKPEEAIEWYEKALEVAIDLRQAPFIAQLNERLYFIYKQLGNTDKALASLEEFKSVSDSLNEIDSENALADLESNLELKRQTEINTLLEEKQAQQESQLAFRKAFIIAAIVVIVLISVLFYFSYQIGRDRKKINAALRQQKEELEDLNANKNKFFAIVAHDLRSPLASMQGILSLLKESDLTFDEIKNLSKELEPALQRNIDTMNDLLVWSRNQMTDMALVPENVDCNELIEDLIDKNELLIKAKDIQITNSVVSQTTIHADKNALRLILRNLLINAVKFTDNKGSITFEADQDSNYLTLKVIDTGIGIPDEIKPKLFTEEIKSRTGTSGEHGTGFGLRLSKEFANRMQGELTFESTEGEGTTFILKLPIS